MQKFRVLYKFFAAMFDLNLNWFSSVLLLCRVYSSRQGSFCNLKLATFEVSKISYGGCFPK